MQVSPVGGMFSTIDENRCRNEVAPRKPALASLVRPYNVKAVGPACVLHESKTRMISWTCLAPRRSMLRFFVGGWLRTIWTISVMVMITLVLAPPLIVISLFEKTGSTVYWLMRLWARLVSWSMGLTFSIRGTEKLVPGASYIVTPNHQGNADILALIATLPFRFRWVIKRELLRIPLFGWALGRTGAISLNRSNRTQAVRSLEDAGSKLAGGWSVLIYPEGSRTSDGNLQPFKKGAFMMAVQTGTLFCRSLVMVLSRSCRRRL